MTRALDDVRARLGPDADRLLDRFATEFPGATDDPEPATDRLEELLLIRIANENPALGPLRELVDDRAFEGDTGYATAITTLETTFAGANLAGATEPGAAAGGPSLVALLRAPARHAPTSLHGQLRYVREHWPALLGDALGAVVDQVDRALGVLAEEEHGLHLRFGGDPGTGPTQAPSLGGPARAADEPEAFSADSAWMPRVVLLAKSTYVWLDQLSRASPPRDPYARRDPG